MCVCGYLCVCIVYVYVLSVLCVLFSLCAVCGAEQRGSGQAREAYGPAPPLQSPAVGAGPGGSPSPTREVGPGTAHVTRGPAPPRRHVAPPSSPAGGSCASRAGVAGGRFHLAGR